MVPHCSVRQLTTAFTTFRCSEGMRSPKRSIYSGAYFWKISFTVVMAASFHQIVDDAVCPLVALGCEMEIDHGGVQTAMAQVLLDATDIDAGFQKMGGIAVSERMNGDALLELELLNNASECPLHGGVAHGLLCVRPFIAAPSKSREDPFGVSMSRPVLP